MDFSLPESGDDVSGLARDIATAVSTPERVAELESARAPIDAELWRQLGNAGLLGLELTSEDAGDAGGDLGVIENALIATELGRTLARVPFGPHAIAALPVIAAHGSTALREQVLASGASGGLVVSVAVEEDLGSPTDSPTTSLSSDGSRLSGVKVNVPYAEAADLLLVDAVGPDGVVVVAVRTDSTGVRVTAAPSTGLIPTAQVEFDDVPVDPDAVLEGSGVADALWARVTLACCAEQSGVVQRALELTAEYAREREQFGRAIGSFQAVAQRLADGYIDAQGLALTATQAAWLLANSDNATEVHNAIATAKFWAAEAGHRVAHTTVHVHGGVGLDTSHPVHRYFLRAKHNEFAYGSATASVRAIGAELAATPA
ncbi:acyl-CoA dehydrogenase family protein [Gordonia amicalis]|uniref:Acyl-CoA dehydrogenase family protein n=1 Tax=Gordonia amicalis TaxID=89053 RepID=A0ABU4DFU1_9ACTN|nr:acyl-CoA dehydrogenase family protein [Gordonia amicalis]MDV6308618.1 acyl-CoA dehydrogenase family protein [Gordonia amicalis]MDV7100788.1 acyl-CoA dehydrogenase family protein [Gordonia amicalis]